MKSIAYRAKKNNGLVVEGVMYVSHVDEFWDMAFRKGWSVLSLKKKTKFYSTQFFFGKQQDWVHIFSLFCRLVNARLTEIQAIQMLWHWAPPLMRPLLQGVQKSLQQGRSLSQAFTAYSQHIPFYFIVLMQLGETTHTLVSALSVGVKVAQDNTHFKRDLRAQIRYPLFLFVLLMFLIVLYSVFLIPDLKQFHHMLDSQAPAPPSLLWVIIALLSMVIVYALVVCVKIKKQFDWVMVLSYISLLLQGGLSLHEAIKTVAQYHKHNFLNAKLNLWSEHIQHGVPLDCAFSQSLFHDPLTQSLLHSATQTNQVAEALSTSYDFHKTQLQHRLSRMIQIIQPVLILIFGIVLCYIIIGVYLPLYDRAFLFFQ